MLNYITGSFYQGGVTSFHWASAKCVIRQRVWLSAAVEKGSAATGSLKAGEWTGDCRQCMGITSYIFDAVRMLPH